MDDGRVLSCTNFLNEFSVKTGNTTQNTEKKNYGNNSIVRQLLKDAIPQNVNVH